MLKNSPQPTQHTLSFCRYINTWGMVLIGMLECFAVGWVYKIENQYKKVPLWNVLY